MSHSLRSCSIRRIDAFSTDLLELADSRNSSMRSPVDLLQLEHISRPQLGYQLG